MKSNFGICISIIPGVLEASVRGAAKKSVEKYHESMNAVANAMEIVMLHVATEAGAKAAAKTAMMEKADAVATKDNASTVESCSNGFQETNNFFLL